MENDEFRVTIQVVENMNPSEVKILCPPNLEEYMAVLMDISYEIIKRGR